MTVVVISDVEVKGLTRGQIKELRAAGISIVGVEALGEVERDDALDTILATACPDLDVDVITPGQAMDLYVAIIRKTYAGEPDLKKSEPPQDSTSAGGGSTAKSAGKEGSRPKGTARKSKKKGG